MHRAIPIDHPELTDALVFLGVHLRRRVGHPRAIRRDHWSANANDAIEVVEIDGAFFGSIRRMGGAGQRTQQTEANTGLEDFTQHGPRLSDQRAGNGSE